MENNSTRNNPHKVSILISTRRTFDVIKWLRDYESLGSYQYKRDWESGHNTKDTMALQCRFSNEEDAMVFALKFR